MRTTSSGLLLLLTGIVLLSAFVNGALPRLLDTLFSAGPAGTAGAASAVVRTNPAPLTSVQRAATGQSA